MMSDFKNNIKFNYLYVMAATSKHGDAKFFLIQTQLNRITLKQKLSNL